MTVRTAALVMTPGLLHEILALPVDVQIIGADFKASCAGPGEVSILLARGSGFPARRVQAVEAQGDDDNFFIADFKAAP